MAKGVSTTKYLDEDGNQDQEWSYAWLQITYYNKKT
jgi:hypothetical protein